MSNERFDYTNLGKEVASSPTEPKWDPIQADPPRRSRGISAVVVAYVPALFLQLLIFGGIGAIFYFEIASIKDSDIYRVAVERARSHAEVQSELGTPINPGWYVTGDITVHGNDEQATLSLPLAGTQRSGTLFIKGGKRVGKLYFDELAVVVETGERIGLPREPD